MPATLRSDPLQFMKENIVICPQTLDENPAASGLKAAALTPMPHFTAHRHGRGFGVYSLAAYDRQKHGTEFLHVFWYPYAQNQTFTCRLNRLAVLCFTPAMDGCSFGIRRLGNGRAEVAHANAAAGKRLWVDAWGQGIDEAAGRTYDTQNASLRRALGHRDITVIDPSRYLFNYGSQQKISATTFGIREGDVWRFFTQRYTNGEGMGVPGDPRKLYLRGVEEYH